MSISIDFSEENNYQISIWEGKQGEYILEFFILKQVGLEEFSDKSISITLSRNDLWELEDQIKKLNNKKEED